MTEGAGIPEAARTRSSIVSIKWTSRPLGPPAERDSACTSVRNLADAIEGRVWLEETGDHGSVFAMSVPLRPGEASNGTENVRALGA